MGKERPRVTLSGVYTPERTLTYEARLQHRAQDVVGHRPLLTGPLNLEIVAFMPIAESKPRRWREAALAGEERPVKKPDWDNIGKMLDALNLVVWTDDAQIVDGRVQKFYWSRPGLVMRIWPAPVQRAPEWALRYVSDLSTGVSTEAGGLFE